MTSVQQKATALFAALALAVGCALVVALPQQAYATTSTKLVAGSTFSAATNLALTDKSLAATNYTAFNDSNDNNFYKFTTSNRNSRYKLTLRSFEGDLIYVTVYDAKHHRIAQVATASMTGKSWTFKNLKRNAVYFVEVWRFAVGATNFVVEGDTLGEGYAEAPAPEYRITMKEVITAPKAVTALKARSAAKGKISVKFRESATAEYYRVDYRKTTEKTWHSFKSGMLKKTSCTITNLNASSKYQIRVRPWRVVKGQKYVGSWNYISKTFKANGAQTKWIQ